MRKMREEKKSDLDICFTGMAFIIQGAHDIIASAIETCITIKKMGKPTCLWMVQPWCGFFFFELLPNL